MHRRHPTKIDDQKMPKVARRVATLTSDRGYVALHFSGSFRFVRNPALGPGLDGTEMRQLSLSQNTTMTCTLPTPYNLSQRAQHTEVPLRAAAPETFNRGLGVSVSSVSQLPAAV
jgi:hypothetical protein